MKKLLFTLFVAISFCSFAQETKITTFILVRHAEKNLNQSGNDPELSEDGKARTARLTALFQNAQIDAVYSTEFKRTRQTVEALAQSRSLAVTSYQPMVKDDFDLMLKKHQGQTVLVSGHSNTIPHLINYLVGEDKYKSFADDDYGNLVIVSVTERGKNAKVTWLRF
jgi:2,3-bisphosphoglycerate-dependent phosphoglycerate mutase